MLYAEFRDGLSEAGRAALDGVTAEELSPEAEAGLTEPCFCLVECMDGEWPVHRTFRNVEGMVRRLAQLQKSDTVGWAYYGHPMPFTRGPQRYMMLPGRGRAIQIPMFEGGPCTIVPTDLVATGPDDLQDDGFLGPKALSETKAQTEGNNRPPDGGDDEESEVYAE